MAPFVSGRALPFLAVFAATLVLNGVAMTALFSRGYGYLLSPVGVLLGATFAVALAAACRFLLRRVKKLPPEETGVVADAAALRGFALGTLAGFAGVALVAGMLLAAGAASVAWRGVPGWALGPGIVAFALNALFQQLGVQSLALAARGERMTWGAAALPLLVFVGPHLAPGVTAAYAVNVALFGAVTMALFFRGERPSCGAPAGFHGAWNLAMLTFGMLPEGRGLGAFTWTSRDRLWSGGDAGPEGGVAYTLVIGAAAAALWADARRRA